MEKYIEDIYKEYGYKLENAINDFDNHDDTKHNNYIYAWYVSNGTDKCFYVGKGKNKRYEHIMKEIETYENNPRKYKGYSYKLLKDAYGIEHRLLYENLTDKEACILEAYTILTMLKEKQPLLNVVLPHGVMEDEELLGYRDSYFYERDKEKFIQYYK